jgi:hypothetical protein
MTTRDSIIRCVALAALTTACLLVSSRADGAEKPFKPVSRWSDWQVQDHPGTRGIVAVERRGGRLKMMADLVGGDASLASGEVLLDLHYFAGLEDQAPLDLAGRTILVDVKIPFGFFFGEPDLPNGIQVFAKDDGWRSQYGTWTNAAKTGKITAALTVSADAIPGGWTDDGFDPTKIIMIGVKFGIGDGSVATYNGPLQINRITVTPTVPLSPEPAIARSVPKPRITKKSVIELAADGFQIKGKPWFAVGGNWRGIGYGQNFGANAWFPLGNGVAPHRNFTVTRLTHLRRAGVKLIRVGLLDDGRSALDADGLVVGYDDIFKNDVRVLLDAAIKAGIKVEFTLVDHLLAFKGELVEGVWMFGRAPVITDATTRDRFVAEFLVPFLADFGAHPGLFGFDLINEPEWLVAEAEGGGWEHVDPVARPETPVAMADLAAFTTACIAAIRDGAPGKFVTVGVSTSHPVLVAAFAAQPLDYLALHHYPYMGDFNDYVPDTAGKPWLLEEYPAWDKDAPGFLIQPYLDPALAKGAAGALLWNLTPGIDDQTPPVDRYAPMLIELRDWVNRNPHK